MVEAKKQGKIRHIGITAHLIGVAEEIVESGLYETIQFPFCYLATDRDIALVKAAEKADMGFIAMKGLSGGLLTNSDACMAFMSQYNALPLWGIQREEELSEWLGFFEKDVQMTDEIDAFIKEDRKNLMGDFCRGCGYCMPCPQGVDIPGAFRCYNLTATEGRGAGLKEYLQTVSLRREPPFPSQCIGCGKCERHCPQHLPIIEELKKADRTLRPWYIRAAAFTARKWLFRGKRKA
jgi:predicted aldo/keto reductase-like oxidoreductase